MAGFSPLDLLQSEEGEVLKGAYKSLFYWNFSRKGASFLALKSIEEPH